MSDYAGAIAAIKARAVTLWTATPLGFLNEAAPTTVDENGNNAPWVLFEIVSLGSDVLGNGVPGNHVIAYDGLIKAYVFIPSGTIGTDVGFTHAVAFGEIFKNVIFYNDGTPGCYVRTGYPRVEDGNAGSDDGNWFGVTAVVPFSYFHRG